MASLSKTNQSEVACLPDCNQTWAHSIVSQAQLKQALEQSGAVTAVETDVVLGTCVSSSSNEVLPIAAHPPDTSSDLTLQMLLECLRDKMKHAHIKLDIKQDDAVVPTLRLVQDIFGAPSNKKGQTTTPGRTLFLNADILPGPGRSEKDMKVSAIDFVSKSQVSLAAATSSLNVAFSLGWNVDVCWPFGYTAYHVQQMNQLLDDARILAKKHNSTVPLLVVWAVNARLLVKSDPQPFLEFLAQGTAGDRQLLVWSGVGEPPIGMHTLQTLIQNYQSVPGQVGFDVQIADGLREALMHDAIMYILGWRNLLLRLGIKAIAFLLWLPMNLLALLFWFPQDSHA